MKSHISATIDRELIERVDAYRISVRRSRSQVIELAVEKLLEEVGAVESKLLTSRGSFAGRFSREETYGNR